MVGRRLSGAAQRTAPVTPPVAPGIDALTGIRTSKPTYYAEYRHTVESLERALSALDRASGVLVTTGRGPRTLCRSVVETAAEHLGAEWAVIALVPDELPDTSVRLLARVPSGEVVEEWDLLPVELEERARAALAEFESEAGGVGPGVVTVPLVIDERRIGVLLASFSHDAVIEPVDLAILRILANQTAVSLQSDHLLCRSEALRLRTDELYRSATEQAKDLAERHDELRDAQARLGEARQRELLDRERTRIARELHDSVAQHVLSAGMAIEWCRGEVPPDTAVYARLDEAKALTRTAVERLRAAIYALRPSSESPSQSLPDLLRQLRGFHAVAHLDVVVRVWGRPVLLDPDVQQSIFRIASECLFNTAAHAHAIRAAILLSYRTDTIRLCVDDDGDGDPDTLRRLACAGDALALDGYHRGLLNMRARAIEMGGTLRFLRSRRGGVRVEVTVPVSVKGR